MKTGVELIAKERKEQIEKHKRTVELDVKLNFDKQLSTAAMRLLYNDSSTSSYPIGWNKNIWNHMRNKSYKERLIIAGALIAAEIDRLNRML